MSIPNDNAIRAAAILADLVAFESVSDRTNRPIADFVASRLADAGASVECLPTAEAGKINVLGQVGPDGPDGLLLSGHLDVVPADQPGWESDPFRLKDGGDRFIGRGAVDMKGFVALMLDLAAATDASRLRRGLAFLFTCDEETGCIGAQHFARNSGGRGDLPRSVVVGEPTELKVVRLHKGHMRLRIVARGTSAHSGYPKLGDNAIERGAKVIAALEELRGEFVAERTESSRWFPEYPYPILTVATVHGGTAFNIVPDTCEIGVGLRLLPGQSSPDFLGRIEARLRDRFGTDGKVEIQMLNDSPPLFTAEDRPIHRRLCAATGQRETVAVHYASDAGPLSAAGLDCVVWGPGSINAAHKPNEYILKRDFADGAERLAAFVRDWCESDLAG